MNAFWSLVVAFFLVGLILLAALVLDPFPEDEDDYRPGFPSDHRHRK